MFLNNANKSFMFTHIAHLLFDLGYSEINHAIEHLKNCQYKLSIIRIVETRNNANHICVLSSVINYLFVAKF